AIVRTLPTKGRLYQVAGGGRGAQITAPNSVVSDPNGRVIYVPNENQNGTPFDSFTFGLRDSFGAESLSETVNINVTPVNDAPQLVNPIADRVVNEDAADLIFDLSNTFFDPDVLTNGDFLSIAVVGNTNPSVVDAILEGTLLRVRMLPDAFGVADIRIRATDGVGAFAEDEFRVTVNPVNDPPVANDLEILVLDDFVNVVGGKITFTDV